MGFSENGILMRRFSCKNSTVGDFPYTVEIVQDFVLYTGSTLLACDKNLRFVLLTNKFQTFHCHRRKCSIHLFRKDSIVFICFKKVSFGSGQYWKFSFGLGFTMR